MQSHAPRFLTHLLTPRCTDGFLCIQGKPKKKNTGGGKKEEETDPTAYYDNRVRAMTELEAAGVNPYPHKFQISMLLPAFITKYASLTDGERAEDDRVSIAVRAAANVLVLLRRQQHVVSPTSSPLCVGCSPFIFVGFFFCFCQGRVMSLRKASGKLFFYDICADGAKVQVMSNFAYYEDKTQFTTFKNSVRRGDIVGFTGIPARSKRGELSIFPTGAVLLSPCLHMLPKGFTGLSNVAVRYRQRCVFVSLFFCFLCVVSLFVSLFCLLLVLVVAPVVSSCVLCLLYGCVAWARENVNASVPVVCCFRIVA